MAELEVGSVYKDEKFGEVEVSTLEDILENSSMADVGQEFLTTAEFAEWKDATTDQVRNALRSKNPPIDGLQPFGGQWQLPIRTAKNLTWEPGVGRVSLRNEDGETVRRYAFALTEEQYQELVAAGYTPWKAAKKAKAKAKEEKQGKVVIDTEPEVELESTEGNPFEAFGIEE